MNPNGMELSMKCREEIILDVIRRAGPHWWKWPFGWFNVCPVNDAAKIFDIDWAHMNHAYQLLQAYHCVGYWGIPPGIRKAIPDLIREALSSKISVVCEVEGQEPTLDGGLPRVTRRFQRG